MEEEPVHILLVDDQPAKLLTYQAILEGVGETLLVAHSAEQALAVLLKVEVALVLLDVHMPGLDGFELLALIRQHPRFEKTAILFVSAELSSEHDLLRGYGAGAVDYLTVPVVPELLRAKVRVFVELYRKTRQLEALSRHLEQRVADRTAQLEASTARLQDSEQRLRLALSSAGARTWEMPLGGAFARGASALFSLLGMSPDEPVAGFAGPLERVHPDDREGLRALLASLPEAEGPFALEFRLLSVPTDPAPVRWMRVTGEVRPELGLARGLLQDISQRKQVEQQLEQETQRKDEFVATLAHELRNPLAPMRTAVTLLRAAARDPIALARQHLVLQRQVSHFARLVDDLLDISRISRGVISLQPEPVDLAELTRQCLLEREVRAAHALQLTLPAAGPFVWADPVRLAQVVSNLLDNAMKFTAPGGRIEVELQQRDGEAQLWIRDSGVGIAPQDLERVFDLFTQVELGQRPSGLGIGLALVRRLVELHGGRVTAHSGGKGEGTELWVRWPALAELPSPPPVPSPPPPGGTACRVLLVDDNRDAADLLAELLRGEGHEVATAYGGDRACELGPTLRPQLVLLDLGMPGLDGFQTAQQMRQAPWGRAAQIYALTGWGAPSDRKRTAEAGFDGHLVKPVDIDALLQLLGSVAA